MTDSALLPQPPPSKSDEDGKNDGSTSGEKSRVNPAATIMPPPPPPPQSRVEVNDDADTEDEEENLEMHANGNDGQDHEFFHYNWGE